MISTLLLLSPILIAPSGNGEGNALDLELAQWSVQELALPANVPESFSVLVRIDEVFDCEIPLTRYSVRSNNFLVYEQREDGELHAIPPPEIRTYRGFIAGIPGSMVSASLLHDGLYARIDLRDGSPVRVIQPRSSFDGGPTSASHVIYNSADVLPDYGYVMAEPLLPEGYQLDQSNPFGNSGSNAPNNGGNIHDEGSHGHDGPSAQGGGTFGARADETVELACDADYRYFQSNGNSTNNTVADIEAVVNDTEVIYQNDIGICYDLTTVIVRTSTANDPYTSNDPSTLLNQFRSEWINNQGGVQRDFAQLFTGRNVNGGVIGIAWLGVVCNSNYGYSMVQSKYTNNWTRRVSLTAHELGHNWNAGHCCGSCSGCSTCHIMCPCNGGCSGNGSKFGSSSINQMLNHKNSRGCLDSGCNGGGGGGSLTLSNPTPGTPNITNTVTLTGGSANGSATVYFSFQLGISTTSCTAVYLGLNNPRTAGTVSFDSNGDGALSKFVPAGVAGKTVYIQALDYGSCTMSNLVTETF